MRCPACNVTSSPDHNFCLECGAELGPVTTIRPREIEPAKTRESFVLKTAAIATLAVSCIILGLVVAYVFLVPSQASPGIANGRPSPATAVEPAPIVVYPTPSPRAAASVPKTSPSPAQQPSPLPTATSAPGINWPAATPTTAAVLPSATQPVSDSSNDTRPTVTTRKIMDTAFTVRPGAFYYSPFVLNAVGVVRGSFHASGGSGNDIYACILDGAGFAAFSNRQEARAYYVSPGYVTSGNVTRSLQPGTYYFVFDNRKSIISSKTVAATFSVTEYSYKH